ncbi:GerW family sporulation protein [Anaerotignum sp. MSJ-24]|uniref:GerW family sporulation protein n=1 Tax=Anaerotignum sp. MSJ-24 TaxID=2841521 RepID=UPI001C104D66|nr:spore germination protein GerW family protein [Anaerotignum sp. MSJ-24]MBU5464299.1 sporulation protein [Anaerotignum sp. MSJ-24]
MANEVGNNLDILFNKMENFISSKTVVGDAVKVGEVTLIPLVDVNVGVAAGAGEKGQGGGGLGAKIMPSAVIAIYNGNVQLINIKNQDAISKLIDMAPGIVSKLNFGSAFGKKSEDKEDVEEEVVEKKVRFEGKTVTE